MGADFCRNLRLKCFALALLCMCPPPPLALALGLFLLAVLLIRSPAVALTVPLCRPVAHFVASKRSATLFFRLYKFYFNFL